MTPHINAKKGEIAKTVLMPGDPLRAKFIAEHFLDDYKLVNTIRNEYFYTGKYKGKEITIAASGMGAASIGIYSYELFKFYDVDNIIRIGSCGSYEKDLKIYEIILAKEVYFDNSSFAKLVLNKSMTEIEGSKELNQKILELSNILNIPIKEKRVYSSDVFYSSNNLEEIIERTNSSAVEMEAYALFINAKKLNKQAACILTVSDNLVTNEETSSEEREKNFIKMMELSLSLVI